MKRWGWIQSKPHSNRAGGCWFAFSLCQGADLLLSSSKWTLWQLPAASVASVSAKVLRAAEVHKMKRCGCTLLTPKRAQTNAPLECLPPRAEQRFVPVVAKEQTKRLVAARVRTKIDTCTEVVACVPSHLLDDNSGCDSSRKQSYTAPKHPLHSGCLCAYIGITVK